VKQLAIDIVSLFIVSLNSEHILECTKTFAMFEKIPEVIDLGLTEMIPHVLTAASRIIEVLTKNPQNLEEIKRSMASPDILEALNTFLESSNNQQVIAHAVLYYQWVDKELKEFQ